MPINASEKTSVIGGAPHVIDGLKGRAVEDSGFLSSCSRLDQEYEDSQSYHYGEREGSLPMNI